MSINEFSRDDAISEINKLNKKLKKKLNEKCSQDLAEYHKKGKLDEQIESIQKKIDNITKIFNFTVCDNCGSYHSTEAEKVFCNK